jgi:hypothetical protein
MRGKIVKPVIKPQILILIQGVIIIIIIIIIINLNTKYKEDQFVTIFKVHESTQPNMNSILKSAAKIIELSQLNGKNDAKQDEVQHTKERLGEVLKKKWKNKVMRGQ